MLEEGPAVNRGPFSLSGSSHILSLAQVMTCSALASSI